MIKLFKTCAIYRPLHVEYKGKNIQLCGFKVYDANGVIIEHGRGFFDGIEEFNITNSDLKRKIKESFNGSDTYILKNNKNYRDESEYFLYIHKDILNLQDPVYTRSYNYIEVNYNTNIDKVVFSKVVKFIDNDLNKIHKEIQLKADLLKSYRLDSKLLSNTIEELKILQDQLYNEEIRVKNYTVSDYLEELK